MSSQITDTPSIVNALVIGGGFYGTTVAAYLAKQRGLKPMVLVEQESALLTRASYANQARIHNGYHYPRSFVTAYCSRVNSPKFIRDWPQAVKQDFTKLYAIARRHSKVTAKQFERFCQKIDAKIQPANRALKMLFNPQLIEDVFLVEEYAFDTTTLANWAKCELFDSGVQVYLQSRVIAIEQESHQHLAVTVQAKCGDKQTILCRYLFNCSYSGMNHFEGDFPSTQTELKHEITELALMQVPSVLKDLGVTVMDGPFFSIMPFPSSELHTLSHVRYTPHLSWKDEPGIDPYQKLTTYQCVTRSEYMVRDAGRYLSAILNAKYVDSLFEIKTILVKSDRDDGRPILLEKHPEFSGYYSILGGKLDNIYDVFEKLDTEEFSIG